MSNHVVINGILSYPNLFVPKGVDFDPNSAPRYGASLLIHKTDQETLNKVNAVVEQQKMTMWPNGMPLSSTVNCLVDGAVVHQGDPQMHYYMVFRAYSKQDQKPTVCDVNHNDVVDPGLVMAGKKATLSANIYAYKTAKGGVSAGLLGAIIYDEFGELGVLGNRQTPDQIKDQMFAGAGLPSPATPPTQTGPVMTPAANGATYEQMIAAGWNDQTLRQHGMML